MSPRDLSMEDLARELARRAGVACEVARQAASDATLCCDVARLEALLAVVHDAEREAARYAEATNALTRFAWVEVGKNASAFHVVAVQHLEHVGRRLGDVRRRLRDAI